MENYTLDELMKQPIVVEVYNSATPDYIKAVVREEDKQKFESMSLHDAVLYTLENYKRESESSSRIRENIIEILDEGTRKRNLSFAVFGKILEMLKMDSGLLVNELNNKINNTTYLHEEKSHEGTPILRSEIRVDISGDYIVG